VECLLVNLLGVPWDQVHEEAERWEHVLSDAVEARIEEVLGHPRADPHGAPIPSRDGSLPYESQICLLDLTENQTGTIAEVSDDDPELLRYLQELGLIPGAAIHFLTRLPFGGPVMLRIGVRDCALGADAARHIYIEL
jgi:DtxR family Mn-dependent transcriptional regulator